MYGSPAENSGKDTNGLFGGPMPYHCCSINGKQLEDLSQTDKQKNLLCSAPVGALNTQLALKFPVQIPSIKYQKLEELQFSLIELGIVEAKLVFILYAPKGLIRRPFKK